MFCSTINLYKDRQNTGALWSTPDCSTSTTKRHTQQSKVLTHLYELVSTQEFLGFPSGESFGPIKAEIII
jgi:hypothetical protein